LKAPPASRRDAPQRPLRLGIFGGSFDPLHLGHLIVAETAREQLGLDRVDFLPAAASPHKLGISLAADRHRAAMIEAAIEGQPAFRLNRSDLDRPAPSYTVDSLGQIRAAEDPGTRIWWILGADALMGFARWREPQRILALARLAVFGRPGVPRPAEAEDHLPAGLSGDLDHLKGPLIGISATDIRARVRQGRSIRYLVSSAVEAYIEAEGLYRG
jgi:nicotinate-nucleotide adenylyltransferase